MRDIPGKESLDRPLVPRKFYSGSKDVHRALLAYSKRSATTSRSIDEVEAPLISASYRSDHRRKPSADERFLRSVEEKIML